MILEVIKFELKYRLNRPATYLYFFLFFILAFGAVAWDGINLSGAIGKVKQNSSFVLHNIAGIMGLVPGIFLASAIMGVAILRDTEHKIDALLFTTTISKSAYFHGRFIGSFIILLGISSGFVFGMGTGLLMPWLDQSKLLPWEPGKIVRPWLAFIVTNMFLLACIFFSVGALTRRMIFVYLQAVIFISLYVVAQSLIGNVENIQLAVLLDPIGFYGFQMDTRYWTIAEKSNLDVPFSGYLRQNRFVWMGVALAIYLISYAAFKFRTVPQGLFRKKAKTLVVSPIIVESLVLPISKGTFTSRLFWVQSWVLTKLYYKEIIRSVPFIGFALITFIILLIDAESANQRYGQELYPVSSLMADYATSYTTVIFMVVGLFYSGEIIWKEKDTRFDQIFDALPTLNTVPLVSKWLALTMSIGTVLLLTIPMGILLQLFQGFTHIELDVYLQILFFQSFVPLAIALSLGLVVQSLVNNKFIGYALHLLVYLFIMFARDLGLKHSLLLFNSGEMGIYSDMNGYNAGLERYLVLKIYWVAIIGSLFVGAMLFYPRGTENNFKSRLHVAGQRFSGSVRIFLLSFLVFAVVAGGYFFYNTNILNKYVNSAARKDRQANYEKLFKKAYGKAPRLSFSHITSNIDLYPAKKGLEVEALITLVNREDKPISELFLSLPPDEHFKVNKITFNRGHKLKKGYPDYFVQIYKFAVPIQPGDTVRLRYQGTRRQTGFLNNENETNYVSNGTFITNTEIFPLTGYIRGFELQDLTDRQQRGLKEAEGLPERSDQVARKYSLFGGIGRTSLDITVSTEADQTAIVPGYLQKQWVKNGRAYFHYETEEQIFPFFSVVSGRYQVKRDKFKNINLEIFYHKDHTYNLPVMMKSLKDGMAYNETNFSPYQYRQIRILEFPKYRSFAQSFPGAVSFSEERGFLNKHDPEKLDMTYYVTAHELAHQWWGHQVGEANVKGGQMYSEGLAQYSALMLLKHQLDPVELSRYLKYELDSYLKGRSREQKKENPIFNTDNQPYVHYPKATLVFFGLQDLIGEKKVNRALKRLLTNYGSTDKYPTSDVLVAYLKAETPDSLQFVVDDLFTKITLFENRVINPTAKKVGAQYEVTIPIQTAKYYADALGTEKKTPIRDYIDVGIFTKDAQGKEKLVYLQKLKFSKDQTRVVVRIKEKPTITGIDPLFKLVDRNTEDNQAVVTIN